MPKKFQVHRAGAVIGEHDEQTLLALLNAGALRLTDTCWRRGMKAPTTMADFICRSSEGGGWLKVGVIVVSMTLIAAAAFRLREFKADSMPVVDQTDAAGEALPSLDGYEIRRGIPVIVGRLQFSNKPAFPRDTVNQLAAHSRVTVLALDAKGSPLSTASGCIIGDGDQVVTVLDALDGASKIQLQLPDGRSEEPAAVIADRGTGVAIFPLRQRGVGLRLSNDAASEGSDVFVAGHTLGLNDQGLVLNIAQVRPGERLVHYQLSQASAASYAGSAVLGTSGDVLGVLLEPESGTVVRAADVSALLKQPSVGVASLAGHPRSAALPAVTVIRSEVLDGNVVATLRNETDKTVRRALLHVSFFATPSEAREAGELEGKLREAAVRVSTLDDEQSDAALAARQHLREVTAQHESAQQRLRGALAEAANTPQHTEVQAVECELPPGLPRALEIESHASTGWSTRVIVLEIEADS